MYPVGLGANRTRAGVLPEVVMSFILGSFVFRDVWNPDRKLIGVL
jgi:hypothetical protein